jgi:uncharacterized protein YcbK (DUF882 family)
MTEADFFLDKPNNDKHRPDRRQFLKIGAMAFIATLCPLASPAFPNSSSFPNRRLSFFNTHTGEHLDVDYCIKGQYYPNGLSAINHILRDHRTEDICPMDTRLLDLLFGISKKLNTRKPFHVISGYRSPATNAMLLNSSSGVAKNSFHIKGQAIDIRLPDFRLADLKTMAINMNAGGVGYYPQSDFIHLDLGPIRCW